MSMASRGVAGGARLGSFPSTKSTRLVSSREVLRGPHERVQVLVMGEGRSGG